MRLWREHQRKTASLDLGMDGHGHASNHLHQQDLSGGSDQHPPHTDRGRPSTDYLLRMHLSGPHVRPLPADQQPAQEPHFLHIRLPIGAGRTCRSQPSTRLASARSSSTIVRSPDLEEANRAIIVKVNNDAAEGRTRMVHLRIELVQRKSSIRRSPATPTACSGRLLPRDRPFWTLETEATSYCIILVPTSFYWTAEAGASPTKSSRISTKPPGRKGPWGQAGRSLGDPSS